MDLGVFEHLRLRGDRWRDAVAGWDCSALLVIGENSLGGIVSPPLAAAAAETNTRLEWVQVPDAGHAIRFDQFDRFLTAVDPFLAGLVSFVSPCVLPLVPAYLAYLGARAGGLAGAPTGSMSNRRRLASKYCCMSPWKSR